VVKIANFHASMREGDCMIVRGTRNYRAPEVKEGNPKEIFAADIYSCGIILFLMKFGKIPFNEEKDEDEYKHLQDKIKR